MFSFESWRLLLKLGRPSWRHTDKSALKPIWCGSTALLFSLKMSDPNQKLFEKPDLDYTVFWICVPITANPGFAIAWKS
jgi:hypothetical protein